MSGEGGSTAVDELEERRLAIIRPYLLPVDEHGNPRSAIEAARQFGVDIEQLRHNRQRSPIQRLRIMQSMAQLILEGRASIQRQKEMARHERQAKLRKPVAPAG